MIGEVKNPFGIRDGKHIMVNDLSENERGLACNCVCPLCKEAFEARLGEIRIHHFAHSGKGCDEVSAYLAGLYGFFVDYLKTHEFTLPEVAIFYNCDGRSDSQITEKNYELFLRFISMSCGQKRRVVTSRQTILATSTQIVFNSNGRPEAVVVDYQDKKVAFVIVPPDTVCKEFYARPYRDMNTIEILLKDQATLISQANTTAMNELFSDPKKYRWVKNSDVLSILDEINKELSDAHQAYLEKQERLRASREEEKKQEEIQRKKKAELVEKRFIEAQMEIAGQKVIDSCGQEWVKCRICGMVAPVEYFPTHWRNRGRCKDCSRKKA